MGSPQFLIWARDLGTHLPDNQSDTANRGVAANLELSCLGRAGGANPGCVRACVWGMVPTSTRASAHNLPSVYLHRVLPMNQRDPAPVLAAPPGSGSIRRRGGWGPAVSTERLLCGSRALRSWGRFGRPGSTPGLNSHMYPASEPSRLLALV